MSKSKYPETIALHGGEYRSDPATTAFLASISNHELVTSAFLTNFVIRMRINTEIYQQSQFFLVYYLIAMNCYSATLLMPI